MDFNCCRLCLKKGNAAFVNALLVPELCTSVKCFLGFEILPTDICSTKICSECISTITEALTYKNRVTYNQQCIKQQIALHSQIQNVSVKSEDDENVVVIVIDEDEADDNAQVSSTQPSPLITTLNQKATARKSTTKLPYSISNDLDKIICPKRLKVVLTPVAEEDVKNVIINRKLRKTLKVRGKQIPKTKELESSNTNRKSTSSVAEKLRQELNHFLSTSAAKQFDSNQQAHPNNTERSSCSSSMPSTSKSPKNKINPDSAAPSKYSKVIFSTPAISLVENKSSNSTTPSLQTHSTAKSSELITPTAQKATGLFFQCKSNTFGRNTEDSSHQAVKTKGGATISIGKPPVTSKQTPYLPSTSGVFTVIPKDAAMLNAQRNLNFGSKRVSGGAFVSIFSKPDYASSKDASAQLSTQSLAITVTTMPSLPSTTNSLPYNAISNMGKHNYVQNPASTTIMSNVQIRPVQSVAPVFATNCIANPTSVQVLQNIISQNKVKVLSVNELNTRVNSPRPVPIAPKPMPCMPIHVNSQRLPIRISLTKMRNEMVIKLTDSSGKELHYSELNEAEKGAVRTSFLSKESVKQFGQAFEACSPDEYTNNLLNTLGLSRETFNSWGQ